MNPHPEHLDTNQRAQLAKLVLRAVSVLRGTPTIDERLEKGKPRSSADVATDNLTANHGSHPAILAGTSH